MDSFTTFEDYDFFVLISISYGYSELHHPFGILESPSVSILQQLVL